MPDPLANAAAKVREWTTRRDQLIAEAVAEGRSLRDIADTTGLSHSAIARIARRQQAPRAT